MNMKIEGGSVGDFDYKFNRWFYNRSQKTQWAIVKIFGTFIGGVIGTAAGTALAAVIHVIKIVWVHFAGGTVITPAYFGFMITCGIIGAVIGLVITAIMHGLTHSDDEDDE